MRWTSERQQVLAKCSHSSGAWLKGKRGVLQRMGAPLRTFCSAIREGEPARRAPSLSQIKPLLLGGRLRSDRKMDGFKCGRRRGRKSHADASPARFDSNMLGNFIRRCWQDWSLFLGGFHGVSGIQRVPVAGERF